jgi:hypothetical protein
MPTLIMNLYQRERIMSSGTTCSDAAVLSKKAAMRDTRSLQAPGSIARVAEVYLARGREARRVALADGVDAEDHRVGDLLAPEGGRELVLARDAVEQGEDEGVRSPTKGAMSAIAALEIMVLDRKDDEVGLLSPAARRPSAEGESELSLPLRRKPSAA